MYNTFLICLISLIFEFWGTPSIGEKSGGTREPGSQKVNWPAESFEEYKLLRPSLYAENF